MQNLIVHAVQVTGPDVDEARLQAVVDDLDAALADAVDEIARHYPDLQLTTVDRGERAAV